MEIKHFENRLEKLKKSVPNFEYKLGKKINYKQIESHEENLNLVFPKKIKTFYIFLNGLKYSNTDFEIIKFDKLHIENSLIHFATFDNNQKVFFEIDTLNNAQEWNIIEKKSNYLLTLTISSFWSNKIWHWLEHKKEIWKDEFWKK